MVDLGKGHLQHQGHPGTCLGEVLLHLGRAHLHIHPVGHCTDPVNGVKGHHCLGGVEGEQSHQFSRTHPLGHGGPPPPVRSPGRARHRTRPCPHNGGRCPLPAPGQPAIGSRRGPATSQEGELGAAIGVPVVAGAALVDCDVIRVDGDLPQASGRAPQRPPPSWRTGTA